MTVDNLIATIKEGINKEFADFPNWPEPQKKSDGFFTDCIKEAIVAVGKDNKFDVRFSKGTERERINWEFLYDICFLKTSEKLPSDGSAPGKGYFREENTLKRIIMALECEWNSDDLEILYDFTKLLVCKADLRVMVCWRNKKSNPEVLLKMFSKAIENFEQGKKEDRYLICIFKDKSFIYNIMDGKGLNISGG